MTSSFAASKLEKQASGSEIVIGVENESGEKTAVDIDDATEDTEDHVQGESFDLNRFSAIFKRKVVQSRPKGKTALSVSHLQFRNDILSKVCERLQYACVLQWLRMERYDGKCQ